jgi:hypothetical protein
MRQTIENTLKFLQRTELKWWEVPAFVECINMLNELVKKEENNNIKKEDKPSNKS